MDVYALSMLHLIHQFAHIIGHGIHAKSIQATIEHVGLDAHLIEGLTEGAHGLIRILTCHEVHLFESTTIGLYTGKATHVDDNRSDAFQLVLARLKLTRRLPHVAIDEAKLNLFLSHSFKFLVISYYELSAKILFFGQLTTQKELKGVKEQQKLSKYINFAGKNRDMKTRIFYILTLAALLMTSCSKGKEQKATVLKDTLSMQAEGDKTIYGMACDGCNDTLIIFLPMAYDGNYDGSNPDTLNILEASRQHKVFGQIRIGDKLAMLRNEQDSTMADVVIVAEDVVAKWCYKVLPTLRQRADMEGQTEDQQIEQLPDSIAELLTIEREYGIVIKDHNVAYSIGSYNHANTTDELTPVVYPTMRRYMGWNIYNGKMILAVVGIDSLGQRYHAGNDTAEFVKLTSDTLVLRINNEERGFYKKGEE